MAAAVADNLSYREVAERLSLSVRTVEYHLANAYRILGVTGRAELAALVRARASRAAPAGTDPRSVTR
ncbi:helix-turn-helix transcriptional regulator [Micromonospora sp. R77]|nr:helix-turn-helix transcriptional regulator [Micromonospora sp. R77]